MALNLFQYLFSCILFFALLSDAHPTSPFEFLKNLQGSQKGDTQQGINQLKQYLSKFGYINSNNIHNPNVQKLESENNNNDDHVFDDTLESAIRTYQLNYHLKATGILDAKTVASMMLPRCGVSDIINGHSRMRAARKRVHHHHHHTVSHYKFFSGSPKWPAYKTNLTYVFENNTPAEAATAISRAFDKWASATHFTFTRMENNTSASCNTTADITIGFHSRDHGDGFPFDGPFGVLGHASPPTRGSLHLDADEPWSIGPMAGHIDMETVALHEIGHLLGLEHSSVEGAIMYPSVSDGMTKVLHGDDVQGIKELYQTI
ncbi:Metalloendoproteinase [Heracleum sosnowskyi]|uniref:Metalloendoproteinase n=1 Tax=Heracleum sosnowskyi TaxID=360622 RepID=A0AAD8HW12_9APIA|nr:Metalloendoproteinase [Heracleum sosnowskyi]